METALKTVIRYPEYKDSGVEWMGQIPEKWGIKRLKYLGNIYAGLSGKKGDDFSKIIKSGFKPFIPFTNICNNFSIKETEYQFVNVQDREIQNTVEYYDILFLMSSETVEDIAKCSIYLGENKTVFLNSFCKGVRLFDNKIDPKYLAYLYSSESYRKYFALVGRGFTRVNIKQEYINNSFALIPPLPDQTAIAHFLDDKTEKIDRAVSIKEKQIALLKERRQIIIQELVTGKKVWNEAKQAWEKPEKTIDSGVEWIGEIPEEWEVKRLKQITETYGRIGFRGYSTSDLVDKDEGAITISPSNIKGDFMLFDKCTYLSWKKYHESPEIKVYKDDVLIVKTGSTFGKVGIASNLTEKATINPQLLVFKNIEVENDFFYEILNSIHIQTQVNQEIIGSTIPTISENKILNMKAIFPPKESEKQIVDNINKLKSKYNKLVTIKEIEIEKLKEYKASLVNDVVLGRVKVS